MNKRAKRANTLFAAYAPPDEYRVENERLPWMLLMKIWLRYCLGQLSPR